MSLQAGVFGEFENFLLGDDDRVFEVEAGQVTILERIVIVVDLIENLPGDVELYFLSQNLHLIPVLVLIILTLRELP